MKTESLEQIKNRLVRERLKEETKYKELKQTIIKVIIEDIRTNGPISQEIKRYLK